MEQKTTQSVIEDIDRRAPFNITAQRIKNALARLQRYEHVLKNTDRDTDPPTPAA